MADSRWPNRLRLSLLAQARLRREGALRAALARRPRAPSVWGTEPSTRPRMMCTPAPGIKARSLRDGLSASLDPGHRRADGAGYRVDGSLVVNLATHPPRTPHRSSAAPSAPDARPGRNKGEAGNAFAMRRSGVRVPSAPPPGTPRPTCANIAAEAGFRSCLFVYPPRAHPRAPQRVETVESRSVRGGAEVVQVDVGGGDRGVPEPGLDGSRVDAFREPEARCGVPPEPARTQNGAPSNARQRPRNRMAQLRHSCPTSRSGVD